MPRPLPLTGRPAWRETERKAYLERAAAHVCIRASCGQPAAISRYGRPGVLCAAHREEDRARVERKRAGLPPLERPRPARATGPRRSTPKSRTSDHRRRDQLRARRRLIAAIHQRQAQAGAHP